ncbi:MAG: hypothetical protein HYR89_02200 [Actinobacteria bacterium]|nr:hypothetical protein [Actinomycetota bacterium]
MAEEREEPQSLYADGWRQGSIFHLDLIGRRHILGSDGQPTEQTMNDDVWVIASQDCDLAAAMPDNNDAVIEIRPVLEDDTGDWGIRSRKLRVDDQRCVVAEGTPERVSPALLHHVARATREPPLPDGRSSALKTWLGLRYDRPAVPDHLVSLAQDIARRVRRPGGRDTAAKVHDVLMQFDESTDPPRAALFAVVEHDADREAVRRWLADAAKAVPTDLGVVIQVDVGTKSETSLELIETSYAADASQITWRGPEPEGVA